jgi:lipoyl(octanoyl) transferase
MSESFPPLLAPDPVGLQVYLLGTVDFEALLALQRRLVFEVSGDRDEAMLLVCEHTPVITVGRQGSRSHILFDSRELQTRGWHVRWVNRGGGVLLHAPGQLAIYPILPLDRLEMGLTEYLDRLQRFLIEVAADFSVPAHSRPGLAGVWVGERLLAHVGVAVRDWVSYYGVALNVSTDPDLFRKVRCVGDATMTSIECERGLRVDPKLIRERVVEHFLEQFPVERVAVYHDHPALPGKSAPHEAVALAR